MNQAALVRLAVLLAALACVLIALGALPALKTASELAPAPTLIDNDTAHAVVVVHCAATCPASDGTVLQPGHQMPAGPPRTTWQLRSPSGAVIGCLAANAAGHHMLVSAALPCPT